MNKTVSHRLHIAALVSLLCFFAVLAALHYAPAFVAAVDAAAYRLAAPLEGLAGIEWALVFTEFGNVSGAAIFALAGAYLLRRSPRAVAEFFLSVAGSAASVALVKILVSRARPEALSWIGPLHSFSFPSGHATTAVALYGCLAALLLERAGTRRARLMIAGFAGGVIILVGASRIVLHVHYASDVLAGYFLGTFWALAARSIMRR